MSKITATLADPADKGFRSDEQKRWQRVANLCSPSWQVNRYGRLPSGQFSGR